MNSTKVTALLGLAIFIAVLAIIFVLMSQSEDNGPALSDSPIGQLFEDEEAKAPAEDIKAGNIQWSCANSSNFDCYEAYYAKLTKEKGIESAFADLKKRYGEDSYTRYQCHPLTHVIGRAAAEEFNNPGEAFPKGDAFCWSGYYHGVLEGVIGRIGLKNLPSQMNSICDTIPGKESYSFDYYNCVHGLGHGVMAITQNELFQSFDYCDRLDGSWEQRSCASGAFMENVIADQTNHFTKYLRPNEPLYPCTASPEKYKDTCYLMQTSYMLKVNGGNFKETFALCGKAEPEYRNTCYASLGRDASGRSLSNIEQTKNICLLGNPGDEQKYCVIGAVKDIISYFHSDKQAKEFCNSFTDTSLKKDCSSTAESYYKIF